MLYANGTVAEGDEIRFEVEIREESIGSGKSLILEEMAYRIAGRRFGMRRVPGRMDYDLFARGSDFDIPRLTEEADPDLRPFKVSQLSHTGRTRNPKGAASSSSISNTNWNCSWKICTTLALSAPIRIASIAGRVGNPATWVEPVNPWWMRYYRLGNGER